VLRRQAQHAARPRRPQESSLSPPRRRESVDEHVPAAEEGRRPLAPPPPPQQPSHARWNVAAPAVPQPHDPPVYYPRQPPPLPARSGDPEDTNQPDVEPEEDSMGAVSGWSVVEAASPDAGVPPSARSLHTATLLVRTRMA
jgi:hypothetical protein